jgi:hypothetical protein
MLDYENPSEFRDELQRVPGSAIAVLPLGRAANFCL